MCAAVRSKHQNVTHFMPEVSNMFFSAEGKQAKEDDMLVSLIKKEKEKSFLYSQNHWTDTAVIKEDRTTKHILGLYPLTQIESLHIKKVLHERSEFDLLFVSHLLQSAVYGYLSMIALEAENIIGIFMTFVLLYFSHRFDCRQREVSYSRIFYLKQTLLFHFHFTI